MKTLYFEGAGWSGADISKATIGNCRIRTAFHLDNGKAIFLEISGTERAAWSDLQYTGIIDNCYYITDDVPNDDCNQHNLLCVLPLTCDIENAIASNTIFPYTEEGILEIVNGFGASFDSIKVLPDLGGYRVFPGKHSCSGTKGYYYGDEFRYDPEMIARREAVYNRIYEIEKEERQRDYNEHGGKFIHFPGRASSPNFSLWVDEFDPGLLHLLWHFDGHNRHWLIRTDTGNTLDDWMATAVETRETI